MFFLLQILYQLHIFYFILFIYLFIHIFVLNKNERNRIIKEERKNLIPLIVTEVSAIFVARIIFLVPGGGDSKAASCIAGGNPA